MVNVEAEVEKKYREKILYKNIYGLSKCTNGTGTRHGQNCVLNENCLYKAILKMLMFLLFSLRLKTTNLPILNLHKARQERDTKVKQTCSQ